MPKRSILALACASALLTACGGDSSNDNKAAADTAANGYQATITRTEHGTAHIRADDYGSLGYGQGYALAEDRLCTLADQINKVRSQRAFFFGAGDPAAAPGSLASQINLLSDISYKALDVMGKAEQALADLGPDARAMVAGYVAGYNRYLADTGVDNLPGLCAGQPWVTPITDQDLVAYYLDLATLAGARNFLPAIAAALPPGLSPSARVAVSERMPKGAASNGIAIGADKASGASGMLLSNTHLPWEGELRYHEVHLTIPGELDVAGVSLIGGIGVQIGFNKSLAWTHTTSPSNQFLVYQLELDPATPLRYMVDGQSKPMDITPVHVQVRQPDGSVETVSKPVFSTEFGPVMQAASSGLDWTADTAYALFDPNLENGTFIETFLKMAKAKDVDQLKQVFMNNGGVPWNHTQAVDSKGQAYYADTAFVPLVAEPVLQGYQAALATSPQLQAAKANGLVILDGTLSATQPLNHPDAAVPGTVPFSMAPQLKRSDFVANANDSYWLSNPAAPLAPAYYLYGDTDSQRTFRTRMGLSQLAEHASLDLSGLQDLLFENRSYTADLWLGELQQICADDADKMLTNSNATDVDVSSACNVLANWDGQLNLDSVGAILFRETLSGINTHGVVDNGTPNPADDIVLHQNNFSSDDPVATPNGLSDAGKTWLTTQLADAVTRLTDAGIAVTAPLGDWQFTLKGSDVLPIHGGLQDTDGAFNKVQYREDYAMTSSLMPKLPRANVINPATGLTDDGYLINYGGSYIMSVAYTDNGPQAEAIMTYSQSDDMTSPWFADQTDLYGRKAWRAVPFSKAAIDAATVSTITLEKPAD